MNVKSMLMPPNGAEKLASRLDPPEYGTARDQSVRVTDVARSYSWVSCTCGTLARGVRPLLWIWGKRLRLAADRC
jgi:hypothetical protein